MLVVFREIFEYIQVVIFFLIFVLEEISDVDDFSKYECLKVVVIIIFLDFEIVSYGEFEGGIFFGDVFCVMFDNIQDVKLIVFEFVEDMGDVKWSFVFVLYDNLEDVNNIDDMDGYGILEYMFIEVGEFGSGLIWDIEFLKYFIVDESEVVNYVGLVVIDIERYGVVDEGNEFVNVFLFDVNVVKGRDLILNEVVSMSVEQVEVEDIF